MSDHDLNDNAIELPDDDVLAELAMLADLGYERQYLRNALRHHLPGAGGAQLQAAEAAIQKIKADARLAPAFAQKIATALTAHRTRLSDRYDSRDWWIATRPPGQDDAETPQPGPVLIYHGHAFPPFQVAVYENLRADGPLKESTRPLPDGRTLGGLRWWTTAPPAEHIALALSMAQFAAEQIKPKTHRILGED